MSLIGKEINEFKVQAYQNGEFKEVTKEDLLGKWNVFFFYPADFTFVCPTELEDLANLYESFQKLIVKFIQYHVIHILCIKLGMIHQREFKKFNILC